jgi:two-component system chemotaxis response regulator CheY
MSKIVLIVDDSSSMRNLVNMTLTDDGFEVIEACDGRDALKKLTGQKVHLVISDVNMPNMDGITFVTELKKLAAYKFVPVVMLTTEGSDEKKRAGQAAGAKAWVVKPFQPQQLLAGVRKLLMM